MLSRKIAILIVGLIAAVITSFGCYTIIKHPSIQKVENADSASESVSQEHAGGNRDCLSCHSDYQQYPYGYYYGYYPEYYWDYPRWGTYYAYPWWWDHYWYEDGGSGDPVPVEGGEKPDKRRGLEPPYTRGADPYIPPSGFGGGTGTQGTNQPSGGTSGGSTTNPPPDKQKDPPKKEDVKPPKRRGK